MAKREKYDAIKTLQTLGISETDARSLRKISRTLRNWYELECGTGSGQMQISVERDENEKPFKRVQYPSRVSGWIDKRYPIADREAGAKRRLAAIMARYPTLQSYLQTDPRGAALYILRPGDVPAGEDPSCYYPRGIVVY